MPIIPGDMDKCRARDKQRNAEQAAYEQTQRALATNDQAEFQKLADQFASQHGIVSSTPIVIVCERGRK